MPFYKLIAFSLFSLCFYTSTQVFATTTTQRTSLPLLSDGRDAAYWQQEQEQRNAERQRREAQQFTERCNRAQSDLSEDESKLPPGCITNGACVTARDRCNAYITRVSQTHGGGRLQSSELQNLARACPSIAREKYDDADREYKRQLDEKEDVLKDIRDIEKDIREAQKEGQEDLRDIDQDIQEKSADMQKKSTDFQNLVSQPPKEVEDQLSDFQQQVLEATTKIKQMSRQIQLLKSEGVHETRIKYERAVRGIYSQCDAEALKEVEAFNARLTQRLESGGVVYSVKELTQSRTEKLRERAANSYNLCRNKRTTLAQLNDAREDYESQQRGLLRQEQELLDQIEAEQARLQLLEQRLQQLVERTDRAFEAEFNLHAQELNNYQQELQLLHQSKQQIQEANNQETRQLIAQLSLKRREQQRLDYEEKATAIERHTLKGASYFGENDVDDQITWNQYLASRNSARASCCSPPSYERGSPFAQLLQSTLSNNSLCSSISSPRRRRPAGRGAGQI